MAKNKYCRRYKYHAKYIKHHTYKVGDLIHCDMRFRESKYKIISGIIVDNSRDPFYSILCISRDDDTLNQFFYNLETINGAILVIHSDYISKINLEYIDEQ